MIGWIITLTMTHHEVYSHSLSQFFFGNQIVIYGNHFADEGHQKVTFQKRDLGALSDHMFSKNVNKVPFPGPWMP